MPSVISVTPAYPLKPAEIHTDPPLFAHNALTVSSIFLAMAA
jgi:hypothetical protein